MSQPGGVARRGAARGQGVAWAAPAALAGSPGPTTDAREPERRRDEPEREQPWVGERERERDK